MRQRPLEIVLEFARAESAAEPFGYPLSDQEYLLRRGEGDYASGRFPWSAQVLQDLLAIERTPADAHAVERLGHVLHDFLNALGWSQIEREIQEALAQGREVHLTVRCGVSELYGVPLELVTLGKPGPMLAALPGCHLRYEWPETHSARPEVAPSPEGGRIVFAWSAAGGPVPAEKHLQAIEAAVRGCQLFDPGIEVFKPAQDELRHVSLAAVAKRLEAACASKTPIAALHLLCHGGKLPGDTKSHGLRWNSSRNPEEPEWVDPSALERVLHPYAGLVRMVVLCACQGANAGTEDNHLGSVAQALHRIGIPVVVTSRYPLSHLGSNDLTERLYQTLLAGEPMHRAVATARQALAIDASTLDWAALQVYSRAEDGTDVYPFTFRPFRGLLTFEARHARFFFGREELTKKLRQRVLDAAEGKLPRFQVVAGISGSGKSSLVKAGLVPMLGEDWDTAELRPSEGAGEPGTLALLAQKLRGVWGETASAEPTTTDFVLGEAKRLREVRPGRKLLLVVDQFEEVFTALTDTQRQDLGQALWKLAGDEALGIVVIATLRVDFFGRARELRLDASTGLDAIVYAERSRQFVQPLEGAELREAIEGPPERVGLQAEKGLAGRLCDDVGHEPGALPLLEHALDALWKKRKGVLLTSDAYDELGKASGVLSQELDAFIESLDERQQKQVRKLLVRLVDFVADTSLYTRRRMPLHELRPTGIEALRDFDAILEKLVAKRLVVRGGEERIGDNPSGGWVEMAHESLIRQWKRLEEWLRDDREKEIALREIEKWAKEWDAHRGDRDQGYSALATERRLGYMQSVEQQYGEDFSPLAKGFAEKSAQKETRRRVRNRAFVAGLVVGLIGLAGLSAFAFQQRRLAQQRLEDGLAVADEFVFDVDRSLEPIAGTATVRKRLLDRVAKLQDKLREGAGDNLAVLRSRAAAHNQAGDRAMEHEDLANARREYEAALKLTEILVARDPTNALYRQHLSVSYNKLGDVAKAGGDLKAARDAFLKGLELMTALVAADPTNALLKRDLWVSYNNLGDVAEAGGDLKAARDAFLKGLELMTALVAAYPTNAQLKLHLSLSYDRLGRVAQAGGDLKAARDAFLNALELITALVAADSTNAQLKLHLSVSYRNLGHVAEAVGDLKYARDAFLNALKLITALVAADPTNAQLKRHLSLCYEQLGDVAHAGGDLKAARDAILKGLELRTMLVAADPANAQLKRDLSVSYDQLGRVAQAGGDLKAARDASQNALELRIALAAGDPTNAQLKRDLAFSYATLAVLDGDHRAYESAKTEIRLALELLDWDAEIDTENVEVKLFLAEAQIVAASIEMESGAKAAAKPHRDAAQSVLDQFARDERIAAMPRFQALQKALAALRL